MTTEDAIRLIQVWLFPGMLVSVGVVTSFGATDKEVGVGGGLFWKLVYFLRLWHVHMYICNCLTWYMYIQSYFVPLSSDSWESSTGQIEGKVYERDQVGAGREYLCVLCHLIVCIEKRCVVVLYPGLLTLRFDICSVLTAELEGLDMGLAVRMYGKSGQVVSLQT